MNNFAQRALTGFFFASTIIGCTLFSEWSYFILLFAINFLCLLEFYELMLPDKSWIEKYLGVIAGSIIFCMFVFIIRGTLSLSWFYHLIPVFMLMFIIKLYENTKREFDTLAYQLFGIMYICFPLVMLADLSYFNSVDYSFALPMGFFILQWGSDTGAYLAGKQFGKHKLFERISPKKTWEGGIGALVINLAIAYGLSRLWDDVSTIDWLIISSIIVVFGTFGDLFESLLKRNLGIKDSGNKLPGHGGVLDRFDGVFFSAPAVYFYMLFTN